MNDNHNHVISHGGNSGAGGGGSGSVGQRERELADSWAGPPTAEFFLPKVGRFRLTLSDPR